MVEQVPSTRSEATALWREVSYRTRQDDCAVHVGGKPMGDIAGPPIDSMQRRFDASDRTWVASWLADDVDPAEPA